MDLSNSISQTSLLTLKQAAQELAVPADVLLQLNDFNILKPTITPDGEIGYTREQIDKFLAIQKLSQGINKEDKKTEGLGQNLSLPAVQSEVKNSYQTAIPAENIHYISIPRYIYPKSEAVKSSGKSKKLIPLVAISSLSLLVTIGIVFTIQNKSSFLLSFQKNNSQNSPIVSPKNNYHLYGSTSLPALTNDTTPLSNDLPENKLNTNDTDMEIDSNLDVHNLNYSQIANVSENSDPSKNLFDDGGNLKGEAAGTDILAAALGAAGLAQNNDPISPVANSNILVVASISGLIFLVFILKKQLAYHANTNVTIVMPSNLVDNSKDQKILEVNQKTDGTVAFHFQGNEYKLCKPELNSESDQFIERLMELVKPDIKELDYDAATDKEIRLNAPLSKLVTRLGFVGLKRDLFFPRTAKNRVFFRKYLTGQDLAIMGLTTDQIIKEFATPN